MNKYVGCTVVLLSACVALADASVAIKDVTAQQRYPWDGKVDISYTVENAGTEYRELSVWAVDQTTGITNVAKAVAGDIAYTSGKHHVVWDMSADGLTFVSTNVVFGVSYVVPPPPYCVIDLSGDTSATSYSVTYLDEVPSGGWSDEYKTSKLVLRKINAGTFTMGSPTGELGRYYNETQHQVTLTKDYYVGVFQVTQRQWELVMGTRPSYFTNDTCYASRPVESVSYDMIRGSSAGAGWPNSSAVDATSFLGILREKSGLALDLPTEAQWEYACRAGTTTALNSGKNLTSTDQDPEMDKVGRYDYNGGSSGSPSCDWSKGTAKVGSYAPNAWGLYDMHGNVVEWCLDWDGLYSGDATDPKGSSSGSCRVVRGGSWFYDADGCRSANRSLDYPSDGYNYHGFRLVRTLSGGVTSGGASGASEPVRIDLTPGVRTAAKTETIAYSTAWVEGAGEGAVAVVSVNGRVISAQSGSGTVEWTPEQYGTNTLTHQVISGSGRVGEMLEATFVKPPLPEGGPYTETVDGIAWTFMVANGEASVGSGSSSKTAVPPLTEGPIVIPSVLGGHSVTAIGVNAFYHCHGITDVTMPDSVTYIAYQGFGGCQGLSSVEIPGSVTNIGDLAFNSCTKLKTVTVLEGTKIISWCAFQYCGLESVELPSSLETLGASAFLGCKHLSSLRIKGDTPAVGSHLFKNGTTNCVIVVDAGATGWDDDNDGLWQGFPLYYSPETVSAPTSVDPVASWTNFNERTSGDYSIDVHSSCVVNEDGSVTIGENGGLSIDLSSSPICEGKEFTLFIDVENMPTGGLKRAIVDAAVSADSSSFHVGLTTWEDGVSYQTANRDTKGYGSIGKVDARAHTITFRYSAPNGTVTYLDGVGLANSASLRYSGCNIHRLNIGSYDGTLNMATGLIVKKVALYAERIKSTVVAEKVKKPYYCYHFDGDYSSSGCAGLSIKGEAGNNFVDSDRGLGKALRITDGATHPYGEGWDYGFRGWSVVSDVRVVADAQNKNPIWVSGKKQNWFGLFSDYANRKMVLAHGTANTFSQICAIDMPDDCDSVFHWYTVRCDGACNYSIVIDDDVTHATSAVSYYGFVPKGYWQIGSVCGGCPTGVARTTGTAIDEFRLYTYALSDSEVRAVFYEHLPAGGPYTETVDGIAWTFMVDAELHASMGGSIVGQAVPKSTTGDIAIPAVLGGCSVTGIGNGAFSDCAKITSVTILSGVTSIGEKAFSGCSGLTGVQFEGDAPTIGEDAFSGVASGCSAYVVCTHSDTFGEDGSIWYGIKISVCHGEIYVSKSYREPTCVEAGCTEERTCRRCGRVVVASKVLPALGHVEVVTTKAVEPTCTKAGCTKGSYCSRCKAVLAVSEVLPALGHSGAITKPAVEPTSSKAGSTAEIKCSRCGVMLQEATVIPALGYIRNVTARQLWPHKKVEVCYTLADDIGEVVKEGMKLSLSCSGSGLASAWARTIIGDTSCTPGHYRVAWDMEADGVKTKADDVKFGVYVGNGNPGFVTKTFCSPSLVFDKTSDVWGGTIVSSPSQLYATSLAEHTTVAYGCYMYMTAGVTYSFKGRYDDFTAVKVNGSWVMGNSSECQESSGSFKPTTTGYYPVEFRVGNNGGAGGCTSSSFYGIQWNTSVNTTWRNVGNTASETVFFASPASSKISGISAAVPIDTSDAVCDGMSVGPTVALGYSPIDTREAAIQIDGTTVFSSTNSGAFVWQPRTKGAHTVKHVAGAYTWTRKVNVTSLVHEVPTPSPGRDPDPDMSLLDTERRLEGPAAASGAIRTKGTGVWTATASDAWITINVATRNVGLPVGYAVAENKGVEERIGYIYVNGHVYTITQPGVGATLETTSADFETDGGRGSVVVRADAQATWHAWSNVDWVSVETTAGQGEDTVTFIVAPYNAVTTRSGTLTIAGTTFTVKQTGRRMKLSAEELTKDYLAHDIPLTVEALASTTWGIALDAPWMSVLDGGTGKGGSSVTLTVNENPSYLPRTATALIGTETFTLHQQGRPTEALSFAISPETTAADVRGANGIVSVLATPDLPWTAESQASWLTVMPGFSFGAGNGNMVYAASPNPTMSNRTGTIRVDPLETTGLAGKTHTVSQPAAVAFISESAHTFAARGESFDVTVMVDDVVGWSISKNADWVSIVGGLSRTGPGKVTINVAENMTVSPRETTIRIAGYDFQVVQLGRAFELEYETIVFGPDGGEGSIEVHPDGDVEWRTAGSSDPNWISVWGDDDCKYDEEGNVIDFGDGTVYYYVDPYGWDGSTRPGWIQIGNKRVYITQRAYDVWIDPCATNVTGNAGAGEVSVSATIGQVWEAIATEPWITVISGASGKGSGTVLYTYTDNNTGVVRTGRIIIAGEAYTVTQAARQLAQVTVMGEGEGTWTGAGTYDKGTRVTLVASPSEGWRFVAWCDSQGETVGTNPTLTVVADRDMTLVAVFEFIPVYIVNGEAVREGTVKAFAAPDPVVLGGTTQLVCRGTSAYPEKGPSFSLKIMGDVRFEWDLWTTNYWVAVAQAEHGTVTARAVESGAPGGRPLPGWVEAGHDVAVTATPESGYSLMRLTGVGANPATVTEALTVGAIFGIFDDTIAEAADAPSLAFRTGGDADWAPVIDPTAKVGYTSVRSGVARPEDETWVETVVSGAGTLAFNWKVDCERDDSGAAEWDRLSVFTNGVEAARLDGKTDWQRVTLPLTAERTTVRWSFYRDDYDEAGTACENAAWIDGVELSR